MELRMRSFAGALVAILAVAMLAAGPASANTVRRHIVHVNETYVDSDTCSFDITVHASGTFLVAKFFDNSGSLYKQVFEAHGQFTLTWTAKGTTLTMQNQAFNVTLLFDSNGRVETATYNGPVFVVTAPGSGVVLLDAGRVVFDRKGNILFEAGPKQELHGDVDAFCAAFG
jgi:hypothetical protein